MVGNEFERALRLMRRHDPQLAEDGFQRLSEIAGAYVDELIVEFGPGDGARAAVLAVGAHRAGPLTGVV
jgi:hypothetical protein